MDLQGKVTQLPVSGYNSGGNNLYKLSNVVYDEKAYRLLSLNTDLASARSRIEMVSVISRGLRELIDFERGEIALTDEDQTTAEVYSLDAGGSGTLQSQPTGKYRSINDGFFRRILANPSPVFFDDERQCVTFRFERHGLVAGFGIVYFKGKFFLHHPTFNLLSCLASQIALVLSNIDAGPLPQAAGGRISHPYNEIIGHSLPIQRVFKSISQVAGSDSTVLILGETGTGKELVARAIHHHSPRKAKPMIKVNCGALPANLIESELFGHERGSFTGALERKLGKFELANGGTLFLDEIGEMPLDLQVKLLRVLQEKEIDRIGGRAPIKIDVRIIAASNRHLGKEVTQGRFRSDLYYRLNTFPISLPSLSERKDDIPLLVSSFIQRFAKSTGRCVTGIGSCALKQLIDHVWPGNIRELEHVIERCVLQARGETIRKVVFPDGRLHLDGSPAPDTFSPKTLDEMEKEFILKTIKYCNGRIAGRGGAAEVLDIPPSTLNSRMKKLGIRKTHIC